MKKIVHIAVCAAGITALLGIPLILTGGLAKLTGGTDAVSSASVIIEKPSGNYTVMINRERHKSEKDLAAWQRFFSGGDSEVIFDDIECVTLDGDAGAFTMAQSFMTRLPENQMKLASGDPVLTLSKADFGRFDVMIVSEEAAGAYGVSSVYDGKNVDVIRITDQGD